MEDKPRYSRISDILDLAVFMGSKLIGVTIEDIQKRYNVSRRTAERMRDSLLNIFPQVDEIETEDNKKHWGFINFSISNLITFNPKELANIEQAARRTTNKEMKEELNKTVEKIKALNRKTIKSTEENIELFLETEGYAIRQMPKYKIDLNTLNVIREGIQFKKIVRGIYHNKERIIEPLGLIYGEKIYLIAREKKKGKEIYNYLLNKFEKMEIIDKTFERGDFNLQEYTNQSFGVYHGEIMNVKLSFNKEISSEVLNYNFHPTQKIKLENDGSVTVNFRASGDREILWHIFRWGKNCTLLEPKKLKDEYKKYLKEVLENY